MLAIKGRIQSWQYNIDEEKKMNMIEVIAEKITYLSSNRNKLEKEIE